MEILADHVYYAKTSFAEGTIHVMSVSHNYVYYTTIACTRNSQELKFGGRFILHSIFYNSLQHIGSIEEYKDKHPEEFI